MRSRLERLCTRCRLRLPARVRACPFCRKPTIHLEDPKREQALRAAPSWKAARASRWLRWIVLVGGGLAIAPVPLAGLALMLAAPFLGFIETYRLDDAQANVTIAGGLVLSWLAAAPLAGAVLLLPVTVPLYLVAHARSAGDPIRTSARDRRPIVPRRADRRVQAWVERLARSMDDPRLRGRATTLYFAGAAVLALAWLVAAVPVLLAEGPMELAGVLCSGVCPLGLYSLWTYAWWRLVQKGLRWLASPPGLALRATDLGRQCFDGRADAQALLSAWTDRAPRRGVARASEPLRTPLGGADAVAYRVRGRVGAWEVDDVEVAPFRLLSDGGDALVRAGDAVVAIDVDRPRAVALTPRLEAWLRARGLPIEGELELAEALIAPGDAVVVFADEVAALDERGYRGAPLLVLGERDGTPLVIRRAEG